MLRTTLLENPQAVFPATVDNSKQNGSAHTNGLLLYRAVPACSHPSSGPYQWSKVFIYTAPWNYINAKRKRPPSPLGKHMSADPALSTAAPPSNISAKLLWKGNCNIHYQPSSYFELPSMKFSCLIDPSEPLTGKVNRWEASYARKKKRSMSPKACAAPKWRLLLG